MIISIYETIKHQYLVTHDDGSKVFWEIEKAFKRNKPVVLDFDRMENISVSALHVCIGQLYGVFPREKIQRLLTVTNCDDTGLIKRVVECAIKYFEDRAEHDNNA